MLNEGNEEGKHQYIDDLETKKTNDEQDGSRDSRFIFTISR